VGSGKDLNDLKDLKDLWDGGRTTDGRPDEERGASKGNESYRS